MGRLKKTSYRSDNLGSRASGDTTTAIERLGPLFNLVNGDLCYANLAHDRIRRLVGLVRQQHPLGPLPAVDAGGRQP